MEPVQHTLSELYEIFRCYYVHDPELELIRDIAQTTGLTELLRKPSWMAFFDVLPLPVTPAWAQVLAEKRTAYAALCGHPVPENELVDKDIDRLFADIPFFTDPVTRASIRRVCLIYAAQHPSTGYQQGFHELVAMVFLAFNVRVVQTSDPVVPFPQEYLPTIRGLFDDAYTEHDTYLFAEKLIQFMSPFYSTAPHGIVEQCARVFLEFLVIHPDQKPRFEALGIIPTMFGVKWLRVLFSREFDFPNNLLLWDAVFSYPRAYALVQCVFIRLLEDCAKEPDENVLARLMHDPTKNITAFYTFIVDTIKFEQALL